MVMINIPHQAMCRSLIQTDNPRHFEIYSDCGDHMETSGYKDRLLFSLTERLKKAIFDRGSLGSRIDKQHRHLRYRNQ